MILWNVIPLLTTVFWSSCLKTFNPLSLFEHTGFANVWHFNPLQVLDLIDAATNKKQLLPHCRSLLIALLMAMKLYFLNASRNEHILFWTWNEGIAFPLRGGQGQCGSGTGTAGGWCLGAFDPRRVPLEIVRPVYFNFLSQLYYYISRPSGDISMVFWVFWRVK